MSLRNAIMNIPCKYTRSCFPDEAHLLAYKEGHRDARHEAAEMVLAQDVIIEELVGALTNAQAWHNADCEWRYSDHVERAEAWKAQAERISKALESVK